MNDARPVLSMQEYARITLASNASPDEARAVFETSVFGALAVCRAMLPLLRESQDARIVNVPSGVASPATSADPARPHHGFFGPAYGEWPRFEETRA